jgi:chemotaxis protein histidine kinase CheA
MNITQTLSSDWFPLLRQLFPVNGLIHVGVGSGSITSLYKEWGITSALLLEADPYMYSQLESSVCEYDGWSSLQVIVSNQQAQETFYQSNNIREHGLIEPEKLSSFWRNLKTIETRISETQTLANILMEKAINPSTNPYNWLIIDCLPAANILEGLGKYIEQVDVIVARATLTPTDNLFIASKAAIDKTLSPYNYHTIRTYEESHPAVGHILYIRDHKKTLHKEQKHLTNLRQAQAETDKQLAALQKAKNETDKQLTALQQAKAEADKTNQELKTQTQRLTQARDDQAKLASECQQQISALQNTKTETDKQLAALQQAKAEADKTNQEFKTKEDLYHVEMAKTETQIELIKEMLLREKYL